MNEGASAPIERTAVVIPARDEEQALPTCLASVATAVEVARPPTTVLVVLDRCLDGSARIASRAGVEVLVTSYGSAGAARAAGIATVLASLRGAGHAPHTTWVACTDADSVVPATWLTTQLDLANEGADCVVGTVEPVGVPARAAQEWRRRHHLAEGHPHVHGANLGIRASTYLDVGGFAPLPLHEDAELVARIRDAGHRCVATDRARVATSGRLTSRVTGGFATYLAELAATSHEASAS